MKIFGWIGEQNSGVDQIRIAQPMTELAKHGHTTSWDKIPGWAFRDNDVIVGSRIALPEAAQPWTRACGAPDGPFMVFETDDNYLGTNRYNPAHKQLSDPDTQFGYRASAGVAHRIVTSTDYLADLLASQIGHPDIVVARNTVPAWMLEVPKVQDRSLVVGWAGGASHRGDWEWWRDGIRRALVKLPDWRFRFVGTDFRSLLRAPRMEFVDWVDTVEDYWRSPALNMDIMVAPLRPEPFNRAKSEIRLVEAGARGIPVVANAFGIYEKYVKHGQTGFLVKDKRSWTDAILTLARDPDLRAEMGAEARLQARQYTIEARWSEYEEAYTP